MSSPEQGSAPWSLGIITTLIVFTSLAIVNTGITMFTMIQHLRNLKNKELQLRYFLIFNVVVVFSWLSVLGLFIPSFHLYIEFARHSYEAIVILTFLSLMITLLGGSQKSIDYFSNSTKGPLLSFVINYLCIPFRLIPFGYLVILCWIMAAQFVLVTPLVGLSAAILDFWNLYGDGDWEWEKGFAYLKIVLMVSTFIGFSSLLIFYSITRDVLSFWKPALKFLCVKMLIFLPIIQEFLLKILVGKHADRHKVMFRAEIVTNGIQNCLIILEMFFGAVILYHAFPYPEKDGTEYLAIPQEEPLNPHQEPEQ